MPNTRSILNQHLTFWPDFQHLLASLLEDAKCNVAVSSTDENNLICEVESGIVWSRPMVRLVAVSEGHLRVSLST